MLSNWLDRRARKLYARSFGDILKNRNDARGVARQLRSALPSASSEELKWGLGYTSGIYDCATSHDPAVDIPVTVYDELMMAAAKLGGQKFWFTVPGAKLKDQKSFTVIIVDDQPAPHVSSPDTAIELPDFITAGVTGTGTAAIPEPDEDEPDEDEPDEDEPDAEVDCHE
jgi:hypothetical protein